MNKTPLAVIIILMGILLVSCDNEKEKEEPIIDPEKSIPFTKEGELSLLKADGELIQRIDIEVAANKYEQDTGLMHRKHMEENQGMLFIYKDAQPLSFYMKNTHIPLDILYFASDSTAINFYENTTPLDETSLPSGAPAQFVLEINAGLVEEWNIEVGDRIEFELF